MYYNKEVDRFSCKFRRTYFETWLKTYYQLVSDKLFNKVLRKPPLQIYSGIQNVKMSINKLFNLSKYFNKLHQVWQESPNSLYSLKSQTSKQDTSYSKFLNSNWLFCLTFLIHGFHINSFMVSEFLLTILLILLLLFLDFIPNVSCIFL